MKNQGEKYFKKSCKGNIEEKHEGKGSAS